MSILTRSPYETGDESNVWPRAVSPALIAVAVFLASAVYYGFCLYPGLGGELNPGDSAKFQILGHTPIMVHGPGYPFVLMLGAGLRALELPLPPWWAMTFLLSAVPGAIANATAFLIVHRLTRSVLFALSGALLLASTRLMAIQATEAEVYALNIAFVLVTLYLLLLFSQTRRPGFFVAACAVYAVSFGNHLMMVMLLPLFVWLTVIHRRIILKPSMIAAIGGFVLLGASQYLYLAYVAHDPRTSYSEYMPLPPSPWALIEYIAGVYFSELYGSGFNSSKNFFALLKTLNAAQPWIFAPLAGLGFVLFLYGWDRKDPSWRGIALLYGAVICFLPFMFGYGASDIEAFHLPVVAPLLLAAMAAIGWSLTRRPMLLSGLAVIFLAVGVARSVQLAGELRARESGLEGIKPALEQLVAQSPVGRPIVALSYPLRMASLYYELRRELPLPAVYRLAWRAPAEVRDQDTVGGIALPSEGFRLIHWIEGEQPDMNCWVEQIVPNVREKWPAYTFLCNRRNPRGSSVADRPAGRHMALSAPLELLH